MGLVVASKRRGPANVGRRLIEAPRQVRTPEREKGSILVGRLVEASGQLKIFSVVRAARLHLRRGWSSQLNGKMSSVVRLVEAFRLLMISSVVRAAKLHMRKWRSSQLNGWELLLLLLKRGSRLDGWELLLLLLKRGSRLDGWELLLLLIVHFVVPAT